MNVSLLVLTLVFTACGESKSGVDANKSLGDLTTSEVQALCEWGVEEAGGAREVDCGGGLTSSIEPVSKCVADYTAYEGSCKVEVVEACITSIDGDPCNLSKTPECGAMISCFFSDAS